MKSPTLVHNAHAKCLKIMTTFRTSPADGPRCWLNREEPCCCEHAYGRVSGCNGFEILEWVLGRRTIE